MEDDSTELAERADVPTAPAAIEAAVLQPAAAPPATPPAPAAPSHPETLTSAVPSQIPSPQQPMDTDTATSPSSATESPAISETSIQNSQNALRSTASVFDREKLEDDGERAGPSGQTSSSSSSAAAAYSAPFVAFSGGGQRLGGPAGAAMGRSQSSSLSALTTAVESPKAKKAKSSYGTSVKVS